MATASDEAEASNALRRPKVKAEGGVPQVVRAKATCMYQGVVACGSCGWVFLLAMWLKGLNSMLGFGSRVLAHPRYAQACGPRLKSPSEWFGRIHKDAAESELWIGLLLTTLCLLICIFFRNLSAC